MIGRKLEFDIGEEPEESFHLDALDSDLDAPCLSQTTRPGRSHCFGLRTHLRSRKYLSNHALSFIRGFSRTATP